MIETPEAVYLGAVVETGNFRTGDAVGYTLTTTLSQPLGDRPVRTIEYGHAVRPAPSPGG